MVITTGQHLFFGKWNFNILLLACAYTPEKYCLHAVPNLVLYSCYRPYPAVLPTTFDSYVL